MKFFKIFVFFVLSSNLMAQGLFDTAVTNQKENGADWQLNGFIRGITYLGKTTAGTDYESKSLFAETALKLKISKAEFGKAFAELRFKKGFEFGEILNSIDLRECWVSTSLGKIDLKIGQQIVVWGRADGINPTNVITPQNILIRSPDEDDKRLSNFLIRSFYRYKTLRFEFIWIPVYSSSTSPAKLIPLPPNINFTGIEQPAPTIANSSVGFKADLTLAKIDFSLSFYNGFALMPGLKGTPAPIGLKVDLNPYRFNMIGTDFSTSLGSWGLRGEFAYSNPVSSYKKDFAAEADLQYVIGLDKSIGNFSIILQYLGRKVMNFKTLERPSTPLELVAYTLQMKNRMLKSQLHEISHSLSFRPALSLMNETYLLEAGSLYNFTTEEWLIRPKISYSFTDALSASLGCEIYRGPKESLFGIIDDLLSGVFIEIKASF